MKDQTEIGRGESQQSNSRRCCSTKGVSIGVVIGIFLGLLIGMIFDQTLNAVIIGFFIGMGIGGVVDARRNKTC